MNRAYELEQQIDRACAAQSPDMLPKTTPSQKELEARKRVMEAKINQQFAGL